MGLHEWPLMVFTVLGQCVVGGLLVSGCVLLNKKVDHLQYARLHQAMFILWLLMGAGFLASMIHLGALSRAFNSLNRVGQAPMSNEILVGILFFAVGGFYWLLSVMNKMPQVLNKLWLISAMIIGLYFVYSMAQVYMISTVPTWNNGYTRLNFFLTMLIGGPLLGALVLRVAGYRGCTLALPMISILALLLGVASSYMQIDDLLLTHSSVQSALGLVPEYGLLMTYKLVLLVIGLALWIGPMLKQKSATIFALTLAFLFVVAGELIGRGVFYGLHMTVGVTYGS